MNQALQAVYANRFGGEEAERERLWRILTHNFFQQWVRPSDTVLDVGAGYCEFINSIQASRKYALDLNPATSNKAAPDVTVLPQDVSRSWAMDPETVNVVFSSNFFEHLPTRDDLQHCLQEIYRVLRPGGRLLAMGPNIRFCYDVYWDFFDHYLPLSDRSLAEALELAGFAIERVIPRFLPYTMKGKKPPADIFVRLYLGLPSCWRFLGKQFFVVASKP
jgi:SAM-dependent methyltransferase